MSLSYFLCDKCGAELVNGKVFPPLTEIWGANGVRYHKTRCDNCCKETDCAEYPSFALCYKQLANAQI